MLQQLPGRGALEETVPVTGRGGAGPSHPTHVLRVLVQAGGHKLLKEPRVVALQLGGVALRDEEQHSHGVQLRVRRLSRRQLDTSDPQGPDVRLQGGGQEVTMRTHPAAHWGRSCSPQARRVVAHLGVIGRLFDDLRGHPEGSAYECVPSVHGIRELACHTEVGQLHLATLREEHVGG